jgi:prepilin-type N-terminal cleavage/methylation domain-containing protein
MKNCPNSPRGMSLIELATALFILAVITAILLPIAGNLTDVSRSNEAFTEMAQIYTATVGDPSKGYYGYVGDTGQFPSSLMDLVRQPSGTVYGWRGPYLNAAHVQSGVMQDPYGSPYECYYYADNTAPLPDQFAIISRGADRGTTNNAASNACTNFNGSAIPSTYARAAGVDRDNIVYPRFTDIPSLVRYNHMGNLSLAIFNFDTNSVVNGMVPGCPHFYTIRVESVTRGSDDSFTMPYNPGANSVDLPQGLYKLAVTTPQAQGSLWEDQVEIVPGATVSRTVNIPAGFNSNTTPQKTFAPLNNFGTSLAFWWYTTPLGIVANGASGSFGTSGTTPRACSQVYARFRLQTNATITSHNQVIDSFVYPYLTSNYTRRISAASLCTLTVLNGNTSPTGVKRQVLVYDSGLLIGVVSNQGASKSKSIFNLRTGNTITAFGTDGSSAASSVTACSALNIS